MKRRYASLLLLLLFTAPRLMLSTDHASISPVTPTSPTVTSPAKPTTAAVRLSPTPDATPKLQIPVSAPAPRASSPTVAKTSPAIASASATPLPPSSGKSYKVKPGDNLYRIGKANGTTLEAIKALNNLKSDTVRVGQTLTLPKAGFSYRPPQPQYVATTMPTPVNHPAQPVAAVTTPAPVPSQPTASSSVQPKPTASASPTPAVTATLARPIVSTPTGIVSPNSVVRIPYQLTVNEAQARLITESENLAKLDLRFDQSWVPPGESSSWDMDCSNTSRYLYKKALGIQLPRCASDQYYDLKVQNKAWDVPLDSKDQPDLAYLERNLQVGDLLFWETTYKPERDPPITNVTILVGKDEKGNWIMAGSQSGSFGKYGTKRGGPDIYVFDPTKPAGGYSTWFGFVHKTGHFVAFGRPLAAYPTTVASAR